VLSVTVYLTDLDRYAEFNEVYRRRVPDPFPARAVVGVQRLPAGAMVEVQAVASR
jgi:2-iminobutanoate/2-iminopropanoate deaminase